MLLWGKQLQSEEGKDGRLDQLNKGVNFLEEVSCDLNVSKLLYQVGGVVVVL